MFSQAVVFFVTLLVPQVPNDRPREAEYLTARADVHRTHRGFDEAITIYRQALAITPDYVPARRGLGRVFDLIGRHADARAEYLAALERASHWYENEPLLHDLATSYVFERRFDDAHAALQRWADLSVKRRGQYPAGGSEMFFDLAMAREAFDEAERVLERRYAALEKPAAIGGSPNTDRDVVMNRLQWIQYYGQRALIAARRGQPDAARRLVAEAEVQIAEVEKVLATVAPPAPSNAPRSSANDDFLPIGEIAFWLGDTARAIRALSTEYVKLPRHNLLLGQAYEREHNLAAARAAYTRIVESTNLSIELAWARPIAQTRLVAIGR